MASLVIKISIKLRLLALTTLVVYSFDTCLPQLNSEALAADPISYSEAVAMAEALIGELDHQSAPILLEENPDRQRNPGELDRAKIFMSIKTQNFIAADDSNFKNVWESGAGLSATGEGARSSRDQVERNTFLSVGPFYNRSPLKMLDLGEAYSKNSSPFPLSLRPKYGFFDPRGDFSSAMASFGDLYIEFRPEIKKRMTLFQYDSLIVAAASLQTSQLRVPDELERLEPGHHRESRFIEAQIWGPISMAEVARIYVDLQYKTSESTVPVWEMNKVRLKQLADKYGFEIFEHSRQNYHVKPGNLLYRPQKAVDASNFRQIEVLESKEYKYLKRKLKSEIPRAYAKFERSMSFKNSCSKIFSAN